MNMIDLSMIERRSEMTSITLPDGNYTMNLYRSGTSIDNYICYMSFVNTVGVEVLKLDFPTSSVYTLLDSVDSCVTEFGMDSINIPLNEFSPTLRHSFFYFERMGGIDDVRDEDTFRVEIRSYDGVQMITKLAFTLKESQLEDYLLFPMYFTYLIDIDDNEHPLLNYYEPFY